MEITGNFTEQARLSSDTTAAAKVFGTYEILEIIVLACEGEDYINITRVNKACHDVISSSVRIAKYLMASEYFQLRIRDHKYISTNRFLFLNTVWGNLVIRKLQHREVIMMRFRIMTFGQNENILVKHGVHFLTGDETIRGLSSDDLAKLAHGWMPAFSQREMVDKKVLVDRVCLGL